MNMVLLSEKRMEALREWIEDEPKKERHCPFDGEHIFPVEALRKGDPCVDVCWYVFKIEPGQTDYPLCPCHIYRFEEVIDTAKRIYLGNLLAYAF